MDPGYRLTYDQFRSCLADCHRLESVNWVHFTGGEPTLWTEGSLGCVDLLLEIAQAGFTPGLTTNGGFFEDYDRCHGFFIKYVNGSSMPLRVNFSVDTFHRNFDRAEGRAACLDSVVKCKGALPRAKAELLRVAVQATVSKDPRSLLPGAMVDHYEARGVRFGFVPLFPRGKAKSFRHLCPDLSSDEPEDLGAYRQFHRPKSREKSHQAESGYIVDFMNLIGDDYYLTEPWRKIARLGRLPDRITRIYARPPEDSK
jgi:hypothetical protein